MKVETTEELEQKLIELRADLESAKRAEQVLSGLSIKHDLPYGTVAECIERKIYAIETTLNPSILAMDYAKKLIESENAIPQPPGRSPGAVALAKEYLKLRGET